MKVVGGEFGFSVFGNLYYSLHLQTFCSFSPINFDYLHLEHDHINVKLQAFLMRCALDLFEFLCYRCASAAISNFMYTTLCTIRPEFI